MRGVRPPAGRAAVWNSTQRRGDFKKSREGAQIQILLELLSCGARLLSNSRMPARNQICWPRFGSVMKSRRAAEDWPESCAFQAAMPCLRRYPSYIAAPCGYVQFSPETTRKTEHARSEKNERA